MSGIQVILRIHARKFFCDNSQCSRSIFTECFDGLLSRFQQKTARINEWLTRIAFELGGNPGTALAQKLDIAVARDTMLARIREAPIPEQRNTEELRVIGIDDWAYRRGCRYGTLVCDIEHHRLIDVLPNRSVATVSDWLKRHPGIQIVSRDRAGTYADAIRKGLPTAQQVADRWHVLKNLGDAVPRYLARQRLPLRENATPSTSPKVKPSPAPDIPSAEPLLTSAQRAQSDRRQAKWERVKQVQQLHQSGVGKRKISRRLALSRKTVSIYLTWTEVPQTLRSPQSTILDPYRQKVAELVQQSLSGTAILRFIREQGYTGSRATLGYSLAELRRIEKNKEERVHSSISSTPRESTRSCDTADNERGSNP